MAFLRRRENSAELMRIIYEDPDVTIATTNPEKLRLNLVKCGDTGTVSEVNVRKLWKQLSNIAPDSSQKRNMLNDFEQSARNSDSDISVTSGRTLGSTDASMAKTVSQNNEENIEPNSDAIMVAANADFEMQHCVPSNERLSCPSSFEEYKDIRDSANTGTTSVESVEANKNETETKDEEAQWCQHPNHANLIEAPMAVPPNSIGSTMSQEMPELQSRSDTALTIPTEEEAIESRAEDTERPEIPRANIDYQINHTCEYELPTKAEKHSNIAGEECAATDQRSISKSSSKRKRAHLRRRSSRQVRYHSSSESDASHRVCMAIKRRRRIMRNRTNVIQVVVRKEAKQAQVRKSKLQVGIMRCGSNQWELMHRKDNAEKACKGAYDEAMIKKVTSKMKQAHILCQKKAMERGQKTAEEAPSVGEIEGSKEQLKLADIEGIRSNEAEALEEKMSEEEQAVEAEVHPSSSKTSYSSSGIQGQSIDEDRATKTSYSSSGQGQSIDEDRATKTSYSSSGQGQSIDEDRATKTSYSSSGIQGQSIDEDRATSKAHVIAKSSHSSNGLQGKDNDELQAIKVKLPAKASTQSSYSSNEMQGRGHYAEKITEARFEAVMCAISSYVSREKYTPVIGVSGSRQVKDDHGSSSEEKNLQEISSSIDTMQEQQHTDADRESEDDQCGDRVFGRFYRGGFYGKQERRPQSSLESQHSAANEELWSGTQSGSLDNKVEFIHMDAEDDTEEGDEYDETETEAEIVITDQTEEEAETDRAEEEEETMTADETELMEEEEREEEEEKVEEEEENVEEEEEVGLEVEEDEKVEEVVDEEGDEVVDEEEEEVVGEEEDEVVDEEEDEVVDEEEEEVVGEDDDEEEYEVVDEEEVVGEEEDEVQEEADETGTTYDHLEEIESIATSSIDSRQQCGFCKLPTCSFPNTSFASVTDTTSGKDFSSVISPTESTFFSDTNSKSIMTDHCHYYDAFNESCYNENGQQVQLLMDNLNKTGFLVNSLSDTEMPETPSKNALTATWRNSIHRPKWDETVDLCLICDNQEFYVHRLVVAHYSRKLCGLLCNHILKPGLAVEVLGINPTALHIVIDWMYTLEINLQKINVLDVFMAAVCLDVKKLQIQCITKMYEIVMEKRTNYRCANTKSSPRSVDIKKHTNIVFRKKSDSNRSQSQSTDATIYRQNSTTSYESPETLEISQEEANIPTNESFFGGNYTTTQSDDRSRSTLENETDTSPKQSRSSTTWAPKQSTTQIAFQARNGQEVSSAPLSKHCLLEQQQNVPLTEGWQQNNLHTPSAYAAWCLNDKPTSIDLPEYATDEDVDEEEEYEVTSESSFTISDKMSGAEAGRSSSRSSSVSIHTSISTFGGSQKSLSSRFNGSQAKEALGDKFSSDKSSSFAFEERPLPPVPSCKKITMRTNLTDCKCDQKDLTEVVTFKKAQTTRITNFKKMKSADQGALMLNNAIREVLINAENIARDREFNVVAPVQINKPVKLMQTYTLAMPKDFTADRVLLFGGLSRSDKTDFDDAAQTVHCYDVASGKYDRLGKLPTPLFDAAACCYGDGIYLTGGISQNTVTPKCPGKATTDAWYLDFLNPVWQKCNGMRYARAGHCLVALGDKIYAIGGADDSEGSRVTQTVEAYKPLDKTWTTVQPLPVPLWRMGAACFHGAIWLSGGMTDPIQLKTDEIFTYKPEIDRWFKHQSRLIKKVAMAALVAVQSELMLVGGLSGNRENDSMEGCALNDLDIYNKKTEQWIKVANMLDPRFMSSVVTLGDQIVIIGGRNSRFSPPLKSVEIFNKKDGKWVHGVKALPMPLSNSAAVGLPKLKSSPS